MFLRKYGESATIPIRLFEVDGIDLRVDAVYAAGDVKITKDEGAEANTANSFTDEGSMYSIVLSATEMQAARINLILIDQTATKVWLDTVIEIETYGNASAQHAFDLDTASVAQTGDNFARLGAPAGASVSADIADLPTVSEFNARTLASADYFDPTTDTVANVTLVATTTTNTDMRGTDNGFLAASAPTNFSALGISVGGAIDDVTLVATTTTNTDMRGTDGANTTTPPTTVQIWSEATRTLTAGTNIVLAKGVGLTGLNDISTADILASGDVDGYSIEETLRLLTSASAAKLSGMTTSTVTIRAADDSKDRITATVDAVGNRSAITLDATP